MANLKKTENLVVFDLDGTLIVNSEFYRTLYSGSLESLIRKEKGDAGIEMLEHCRKNCDGKGELALFPLNIPFSAWARSLIDTSVESIQPNVALCEKLRNLDAIKVVYTGSPLKMALKTLERLGLNPNADFDLIIGWQEPESFPTKWSCSPILFKSILDRFSVPPEKAWAVGDTWETDLAPAQILGIKTASIRKKVGNPDRHFDSIEGFIDFHASS